MGRGVQGAGVALPQPSLHRVAVVAREQCRARLRALICYLSLKEILVPFSINSLTFMF